MLCGNEELSGVMVSISRFAGTCVGTVAAAGKKITGTVTSGITSVGHLLTQPVNVPECTITEQNESVSEASETEARNNKHPEQGNSAKSIISVLESDLASAKHKLQEVQTEKEALLKELKHTRIRPDEASIKASDAKTHDAVLKILESNLAAAERRNPENSLKETEQEMGLPKPVEEIVVEAGEEKSESLTETSEPHFDNHIETEKQFPEASSETELSSPPAVMQQQIQAAVFDKATDKILFTSAVYDIANPNVAVRLDAVKILTEIDHELSVQVLAAHISSERMPQVRQECIKAITTLGMKQGLPAIEKALSDESGLVRMAAVWGLYRLAGEQSVSALAGMLSDKDEGVRRRAATCIGWLGKSRFALDLTKLLDDDSVPVRGAAAEAMGNLGNPQVVMSLIEHLKDPDRETRKIILHAIEKITDKKIGTSFPASEANLNRLIARWRQWWKEEMSKQRAER